jgi:hypothetical protein
MGNRVNRTPKGRACPKPQGGDLSQPRPTAWVREPLPVGPQALKGRTSMLESMWAVVEAGSMGFITPFQGLRTGNRVNFLTEAVSLGFARPPRWG